MAFAVKVSFNDALNVVFSSVSFEISASSEFTEESSSFLRFMYCFSI